jgi:hypothetical protein
MTTYRLACSVTVSAWTDVEADSLEEAIAIADMREVEIGGTLTGVDGTESWVIEEADGSPQDIHEDAA